MKVRWTFTLWKLCCGTCFLFFPFLFFMRCPCFSPINFQILWSISIKHGLSCSALRHQNAACVCWHKASGLQGSANDIGRHPRYRTFWRLALAGAQTYHPSEIIFTFTCKFGGSYMILWYVMVCMWMEMLTLLQASIWLIEYEGSSGQALGMIRP